MKAQMSIFVIVGIVITIVIGSYFMMRISDQQNNLGHASDYVFEMGSKQSSLNAIMQECLKQHVIAAELEYGLHRTWSTGPIREYIKENLPGCIQAFVSQQGYKMTAGQLEVVVDIQQESVAVDVHYPIMLVKQDTTLRFEQQTYTFPRMTMEKIDPEKTTRVVSADGTMIVEIPPGTTATLDGEPVEVVGLKQLDREFNGMGNSVTGGMMAYNGWPHGTRFSQPVTVIRFYQDDDVPAGVDEMDLRLGYYDDVAKIWKSLPTTVYPEKNKMVMETLHFSAVPGLLIQCTAENNPWTVKTPNLVTERCTCGPWVTGNTENCDGVDIESVAYAKGDEVSNDLCSDPAKGCGIFCIPFDWPAPNPDAPTCKENIQNGCGSCSDPGNGPTDNGFDGTYEKKQMYYYAENPWGQYNNYEVNFEGEGSGCQAENINNLPIGTSSPAEGGGHIKIEPVSVSGADNCQIMAHSNFIDGLKFDITEKCTDTEPDGCYAGYAIISGQGFGAKDAFYTCSQGDEPKEMPLAMGGQPNEMVSSKCVCPTEGAGPCTWVPDKEDCGANQCDPAKGEVCSKLDPATGEETGDETKWECKPKSGGGGGGGGSTCTPACTGRQVCKEGKCVAAGGGGGGGGGGECGAASGKCGIENWDAMAGKTITTDKLLDSRDKKFCDSFGDISSGSKLTLMDNSKRGEQCWLFVELQTVTDGFKPDLYVRYDDVKHLLPSGNDTNSTSCITDDDCSGENFCHPINNTCVGIRSLRPIIGFFDVPKNKLQEAKDLGVNSVIMYDGKNNGDIPTDAAYPPYSFNLFSKLNDSKYNSNKEIAFSSLDFDEGINNVSIGYWILDDPCNNNKWSLTYKDIGKLYSEFRNVSKKPVFVNFRDLNCALNMYNGDVKNTSLADVVLFSLNKDMTDTEVNEQLNLLQDVVAAAKNRKDNVKIMAILDVEGATYLWINKTGHKLLDRPNVKGIIISPYSAVSAQKSTMEFRNVINELICLANEKYFDVPCGFVPEEPERPQEYKIAFIANQGTGQAAVDVLHLINSRQADLIIIDGNLGYDRQPFEWDDLMTATELPALATMGDKDKEDWPSYASLIEPYDDSVECTGTAGDRQVCKFKNVTFIMSGVGISNSDGNMDFITGAVAAADTDWKFCVWHKSNNLLRVSARSTDDTLALPYYDPCIQGGAIVVTGYEMQYARTKEITNAVDSVGYMDINDNYEIRPGHSLVIVSGLGGYGKDLYDCGKDANGWWSSVYAPNFYLNKGVSISKDCSSPVVSGFKPGALFMTFNYQGNENRTHGEFINVDNVVVDSFEMTK